LAAVLVVSSILVTQGAFASVPQDDRTGLLDRLARAKQIVIRILSEIGFPPG
jgi:hypothetical protein